MSANSGRQKSKFGACMNSCGQKIKAFDQFGEGFHMTLENGDQSYGSYFGALISVIFGIILIGFAYTKMETLYELKDVDIIESF